MNSETVQITELQQELRPHHEPINVLGAGTFGNVVLCQDIRLESKPLVAIKLIRRGDCVSHIEKFRVYVAREILHHGSLRHPFIVGLYEAFLTPNYLALVTEYAQGGDLFRYLQTQPGNRLPEQTARFLFQQLVIGLQYIHGRGVANRDMKLENLLLSKSPTIGTGAMLKIADFGFSKHELNSSARSFVGTEVYMSPEVIMGGNRYDPKIADIWSVGIVLYIVLCGRYPFDRTAPDYVKRVVAGKWHPIDPVLSISSAAQDLVARLLIPNPASRASIEDIMKHPWFAQGLPPSAGTFNQAFWENAPDPSKPPLSEAASRIDELVTRGSVVGKLDDEPLRCRFPGADDLEAAAAAAVAAAVASSGGAISGRFSLNGTEDSDMQSAYTALHSSIQKLMNP